MSSAAADPSAASPEDIDIDISMDSTTTSATVDGPSSVSSVPVVSVSLGDDSLDDSLPANQLDSADRPDRPAPTHLTVSIPVSIPSPSPSPKPAVGSKLKAPVLASPASKSAAKSAGAAKLGPASQALLEAQKEKEKSKIPSKSTSTTISSSGVKSATASVAAGSAAASKIGSAAKPPVAASKLGASSIKKPAAAAAVAAKSSSVASTSAKALVAQLAAAKVKTGGSAGPGTGSAPRSASNSRKASPATSKNSSPAVSRSGSISEESGSLTLPKSTVGPIKVAEKAAAHSGSGSNSASSTPRIPSTSGTSSSAAAAPVAKLRVKSSAPVSFLVSPRKSSQPSIPSTSAAVSVPVSLPSSSTLHPLTASPSALIASPRSPASRLSHSDASADGIRRPSLPTSTAAAQIPNPLEPRLTALQTALDALSTEFHTYQTTQSQHTSVEQKETHEKWVLLVQTLQKVQKSIGELELREKSIEEQGKTVLDRVDSMELKLNQLEAKGLESEQGIERVSKDLELHMEQYQLEKSENQEKFDRLEGDLANSSTEQGNSLESLKKSMEDMRQQWKMMDLGRFQRGLEDLTLISGELKGKIKGLEAELVAERQRNAVLSKSVEELKGIVAKQSALIEAAPQPSPVNAAVAAPAQAQAPAQPLAPPVPAPSLVHSKSQPGGASRRPSVQYNSSAIWGEMNANNAAAGSAAAVKPSAHSIASSSMTNSPESHPEESPATGPAPSPPSQARSHSRLDSISLLSISHPSVTAPIAAAAAANSSSSNVADLPLSAVLAPKHNEDTLGNTSEAQRRQMGLYTTPAKAANAGLTWTVHLTGNEKTAEGATPARSAKRPQFATLGRAQAKALTAAMANGGVAAIGEGSFETPGPSSRTRSRSNSISTAAGLGLATAPNPNANGPAS